MEVLLADEFGFCFGVERAVEMVEEAVEEGVRPIRSLGPLIHNAQEMERLGARGVSTIDSPDEADDDTIAELEAERDRLGDEGPAEEPLTGSAEPGLHSLPPNRPAWDFANSLSNSTISAISFSWSEMIF